MEKVLALESRDREEGRELEMFILDETVKQPAPQTQSETVGRQTGTAEWKAERGEDGTQR